MIVEIAERVSDPPTDQEALKFHFEDIVDEHDTSRVWHTDVAQLVHLPYVYPFPFYPFHSIDAHAHSLYIMFKLIKRLHEFEGWTRIIWIDVLQLQIQCTMLHAPSHHNASPSDKWQHPRQDSFIHSCVAHNDQTGSPIN